MASATGERAEVTGTPVRLARLRAWRGRADRLIGTDRRLVAIAVAAVVLLRIPFLLAPVMPDEAGFYQVARDWGRHGPFSYGHFFVDRPPGLMAIFWFAGLTDHVRAVRVIALLFAVVFVLLAILIARLMRGSTPWAALVATCFVVNPAFDAPMAVGELFAAPVVLVGVASILVAGRRAGLSGPLFAMLAGVAAMSAMMVKQNFVDAFVFIAVLVIALVVRREASVRRGVVLAVCAIIGALLVTAVMLLVGATTTAGVRGLWYSVVAFRADASAVIAAHSTTAPMRRAWQLFLLAIVTGIVPMTVVLIVSAVRSRLRGSAYAWAIGATLLVEVGGVVAGGSYWVHYLMQLAPMLTLAAGRWTRRTRALRWVAGLMAVGTLGASVNYATYALTHEIDESSDVGGFVAASRDEGDTATVLYGGADVQLATGMATPYPYLWSLPMRTMDPELAQLRSTLRGPEAPTWVIVRSDLNSWDIDPEYRTLDALTRHYRLQAVVCGSQVWLKRGLDRDLGTWPDCARYH